MNKLYFSILILFMATLSSYCQNQKSELVCLIVNGKEGQVMETVNMPGNKEITPVGINNLINYLNHTWGDKSLSNLNEVKAQFENCNE